MQYFKTDLLVPQAAPRAERPRSYRRSVRYGHARLGGSAETAAAPAPTLIVLPRVQAVVDAYFDLRAA